MVKGPKSLEWSHNCSHKGGVVFWCHVVAGVHMLHQKLKLSWSGPQPHPPSLAHTIPTEGCTDTTQGVAVVRPDAAGRIASKTKRKAVKERPWIKAVHRCLGNRDTGSH